MHSAKKSRSVIQSHKALGKEMKRSTLETYQAVLRIFMKDSPAAYVGAVTAFLDARDFIGLMRWADSNARVEHACSFNAFEASQLTALIKKYPFPAKELKPLARKNAERKFYDAEHRCRRYNLRFRRLNSGGWSAMYPMLDKMRSWIRYVLGDKPDMSSIYSNCGFGPGASLGVHGESTNLARKFLSERWTVTPLALPYARTALTYDPYVWELFNPDDWSYVCYDVDSLAKAIDSRVQLVHNNNITFVPKTTLVDRTIAVEPLLNGYLQKGIDLEMRSRLRRVDIDLSDQTTNQLLALLGSLPGAADPFCTIDLSAASDSISTQLVKFLLPPEWFDLLNHTRSGVCEINETSFIYEKFTSMGNGFCFPLETLIFASACAAVSPPGQFTVYGDDIIVRQSVFSEVVRTLRYMGFRENPEKTFSQGPFRESCGADWHAGHNIRPLTLDYTLESVESIVKFHNSSLRHPLWVDRFVEVRKYLRGLVPSFARLVRPYEGNPETAFEVSLDEFMASPFARWDRKILAWSWMESARRPVPDHKVRRHGRYTPVLVMALLRGSPSNCPFALRRKTVQTFRRVSHSAATSLWSPNRNEEREPPYLGVSPWPLT